MPAAFVQEGAIAADQKKLDVLTRLADIDRELFTLNCSMGSHLTCWCDSMAKRLADLQTQCSALDVGASNLVHDNFFYYCLTCLLLLPLDLNVVL